MQIPELSYYEILLLISIACAAGACLGSFFNVALYRIPRNESVVVPASHCPECGEKIKPQHNIPILSYLLLKGRCNNCKIPISIQYPVVEFVSGVISAGMWVLFIIYRENLQIQTVLCVYIFAMISIPIIILDFKYYIIPDIFTYTALLSGLIISFLPGGLTPFASAAGAIFAGGLFWLFGIIIGRILKKEALGFGDVKLISAAGSMFGLKTAVMGIFAGSVFGLIYVLIFIIIRKFDKSQLIPFGPFLCLGVISWSLLGQAVFDWYINFITNGI